MKVVSFSNKRLSLMTMNVHMRLLYLSAKLRAKCFQLLSHQHKAFPELVTVKLFNKLSFVQFYSKLVQQNYLAMNGMRM
jgi:hypothetical protein